MNTPPITPKPQGRRAEGKRATTISLSEAVLEKARAAAAADDRSLSKWIERLIATNVSAHLAAEAAKLADSAPAPSQASKKAAPRQPSTGEGSGSYRRSA